MSEAIPSQHPAVVLRSHYQHLRWLLGVMVIAVVGLTVAVVILAVNNDNATAPSSSAANVAIPAAAAGSQVGATLDHRGLLATPGLTTRYDGGPEEGTRGVSATPNPTTRYDGGPEEGTRGVQATPAPSQPQNPYSYNGGHDEGRAGQ
jgi:hypothetical protein